MLSRNKYFIKLTIFQVFPILVVLLLDFQQKLVILALTFIPHSHQNLSCVKTGVDYSRFTVNDTAEELLTPLLRQLYFWCEIGIDVFLISSCIATSRLVHNGG